MKVAIVYDRVNKWGGAERVLLALHKMFPDAPLFTSMYDKDKAPWARVFPKVITSFIQDIPVARKWHEGFGWLMPIAFESFNFDEYDLVISVTSEAAKGIITKPGTTHICYMLTPTRYLWSHNSDYFKNPILRLIASPIVGYLKRWDKVAASRPDKIVAISLAVSQRIKEYYGLPSEVIYPPTNLKVKTNGGLERKYYLYVGRMVGYKRVELLINVFNRLKYPLIIVGTGAGESKLKFRAGRNVKFVGHVDDSELSGLYSGAKALVMPQEEDFGLVSIESQSHGTPVITYSKGGASETVIDGVTGVHFDEQTVESLVAAIEKFDKIVFNRELLRQNAQKYSFEVFEKRLAESCLRANTSRRRGNTSLAKIPRKVS